MKVYLVECGVYAERWIAGVYATAELAMEAHPDPSWRVNDYGYWVNDDDMDRAKAIYEYEVQS